MLQDFFRFQIHDGYACLRPFADVEAVTLRIHHACIGKNRGGIVGKLGGLRTFCRRGGVVILGGSSVGTLFFLPGDERDVVNRFI